MLFFVATIYLWVVLKENHKNSRQKLSFQNKNVKILVMPTTTFCLNLTFLSWPICKFSYFWKKYRVNKLSGEEIRTVPLKRGGTLLPPHAHNHLLYEFKLFWPWPIWQYFVKFFKKNPPVVANPLPPKKGSSLCQIGWDPSRGLGAGRFLSFGIISSRNTSNVEKLTVQYGH